MDKRTIIAMILTVIVITVSMVIQTTFFAPPVTTTNTDEFEESVPADEGSTVVKKTTSIVTASDNAQREVFTFETDLYQVEFDSAGASVSALRLKEHKNSDGSYVDLLFRGETDNNAFLMYWGDDTTNPVTDVYSHTVNGDKVVFSRDYTDSDGDKFTVKKTFEFKQGEYLFAVTVDILGDGNFNGLNVDGYAYTLAFEPQVGPAFTQMKNDSYDYRKVYVDYYKSNGKLTKSAPNMNSGVYTITDRVQWMQVTSKYFSVVAMPKDNTIGYKFTARQSKNGDISQSDSIYIARTGFGTDDSNTIYFYAGPQLKKYLGSYYSGMDNSWGIRNSDLDRAAESSSMFGWLETILMWILSILYKIIPNYGVGIILLTLIMKALLWPLSKKSVDSSSKMAALQPKMQELQAKYKDNPQKLNQETAALYRDAGVSPLGGCLPMLLQFPILLAMFGLLNKHFELRGAMFIPNWIVDLSAPETVFTLPFNIPLLGNEIHLLPILYTLSMIYSMKMTNTQSSGGAQGQGMMKFMTYGMPLIFFFVLYSSPSGLLLYWSVQNALSIFQQMYINNKRRKNPDANKKGKSEENVPEAVRKYQEKLKKLEDEKAKQAKNNKKK